MKASKHIFVLLAAALVFLTYSMGPAVEEDVLEPYYNGVFPSRTPGEVSSWGLEDPYPNLSIASPLRIQPFPNTDDYLVLGKIGEVFQVNFEEQTQKLLLDLTDRAFKAGESGTTGMVLHPDFGDAEKPENQFIFIFYRTKPLAHKWDERGMNRLAKYRWDENSGTFDLESEEVLFQQYDRSTWHNGGALWFGPDGFLYVALGDEGFEGHIDDSTQRLDRGLFSGILRIDVDNDPTKSHPIIRQPISNQTPPDGWGETFTQGYGIPNDNPWLSPEGEHLEEFFAIGVRSPYSTFYDPVEDKIWNCDVGSDKFEEVNTISREDNLQWPYMEGDLVSETVSKPNQIIGNEKPPLYFYSRDIGNTIIGSSRYRGGTFLSLHDQYLVADYSQRKLMKLQINGDGTLSDLTVMVNDAAAIDADLPETPGISGIHFMRNGDILLTMIGIEVTDPGRFLRLTQNVAVADPPAKLSELGIFSNLQELEVADGILPYNVNSPLWSDGAEKKRWMAVPSHNKNGEKVEIEFRSRDSWAFPEGTVFIKHFELPTSNEEDGPIKRLETRFFVIAEDGSAYGLTYRWNDEQTDAFLLTVGETADIDIYEDGEIVRQQKWSFPSRTQCMRCHNKQAKFVLGLKTHQLNGPQYYEHAATTYNQLEYLSSIGKLNTSIEDGSAYPMSYAIDDESVDLELRIRSYFDANCSSCHQLGGVPEVSMDLRFGLPLDLANIINLSTQSSASDPEQFIIATGDHMASELYQRNASLDTDKMPPVSKNVLDEIYLEKLAEWIDQLDESRGIVEETVLFPNPSQGFLYARFPDAWAAPISINIYDLNGNLIHQEISPNQSVYLELTVPTPGIYILQASSEEGEHLRTKFMVQ